MQASHLSNVQYMTMTLLFIFCFCNNSHFSLCIVEALFTFKLQMKCPREAFIYWQQCFKWSFGNNRCPFIHANPLKVRGYLKNNLFLKEVFLKVFKLFVGLKTAKKLRSRLQILI